MTTTPVDRIDFGAGRLFVSDTRLALGALNYARYETLRRVFGVSREEANLLTFLLALGGTDAGLRGARQAVRVTRKLSRADSAMGGFVLRGAVLGITGQSARRSPSSGRCWQPPCSPVCFFQGCAAPPSASAPPNIVCGWSASAATATHTALSARR